MRLLCALAMLALPQLAGAQIVQAGGAHLRVLDKMSGVVSDYTLATGATQVQGRLTVQMDECRYPADLPTAEAFAHLTILDSDLTEPAFAGWMVASSPALSALDNPRYDVWVLRCDVPSTSEGVGSGG